MGILYSPSRETFKMAPCLIKNLHEITPRGVSLRKRRGDPEPGPPIDFEEIYRGMPSSETPAKPSPCKPLSGERAIPSLTAILTGPDRVRILPGGGETAMCTWQNANRCFHPVSIQGHSPMCSSPRGWGVHIGRDRRSGGTCRLWPVLQEPVGMPRIRSVRCTRT